MTDLTTAPLPLTTLSEEEEMFRSAVREFAESDIRPHVHAMDARAQFNAVVGDSDQVARVPLSA